VPVDLTPCGDRVAGVLQQFAEVHAGSGVDMPAEQVDDAAQVHLELL
jgi:hypothetical protein